MITMDKITYRLIIREINDILNSLSYRKHRRKADKLHKKTGKRYFVIPESDTKCIVVNNDWLKYYNRKVPKSKRLTFKELCEMAYYSTGRGKL